jgi:hypothetical protein
VPPAVALLNYISCGKLWRIFSQAGISAGFSLKIIFIVGSIGVAAIAGDLIFFCLGGSVGDYTGAHCDFSRDFSINYSPDGTSEAAMCGAWLGAGEGGHYIFRMPNSLEGCDG